MCRIDSKGKDNQRVRIIIIKEVLEMEKVMDKDLKEQMNFNIKASSKMARSLAWED